MTIKDKQAAKDFLGKQFLIAAYIEPRLQLVNYIKEGYDNNIPVLMTSRFLHFTAHNFYRSIIVDLHALFGKAGKDNLYAFGHIRPDLFVDLDPQAIVLADAIRDSLKSEINTITRLRHQQIAHFNFEQNDGISLNFDQLETINALFNTAVRLVKLYGASFKSEEDGTDYDFGRESDYVRSLKRLLEKVKS